jgi:tripartite-type tricarboxylate transporter receptor subunit TctC
MQSAEMKQRMAEAGSLAVGSTRDAFAKHLADELAKWARVIKASGATAD